MKRSWAFAAACAVGALAFAPRQAALDDLARRALARVDGEIQIPQTSGLRADVRVVRDEWGIPHITAASPDDLFFAQGYVVAQDRLWQMEIWRRTAEGRLAEISGPQAVPGDRLARLLKYRGPSDDRELTPYHPDARRLMTAFVSGVNTFIAQHRERLPIEFVLTGIVPEPWTIETLTLRQTTFGDATNELQLARSVAALGAAEANRRRNPDPWDELTVPDRARRFGDRPATSSPRHGPARAFRLPISFRRIGRWPARVSATFPVTTSSNRAATTGS